MTRPDQQRDLSRALRRSIEEVGREITLARTNLALTERAAARVAGVSPATQRRAETGDSRVQIETLGRVAHGVGLKIWLKAFPVRDPSLRDTGQLRIAEYLGSIAHSSLRVAFELGLGNGRSIDTVAFGPTEIVAYEIERMVADLQDRYRMADAKRAELASQHQRPVRLVVVVEDSRQNRRVLGEHEAFTRTLLPAGSRQVLVALRSGQPLGRDGLLWTRSRRQPGGCSPSRGV